MKSFTIKYLSFLIITLMPKLVLSQTTIFSDNFDSYNVGQQLVAQNPTDWIVWSNSAGGGTEDPFISNLHSVSGSNSVVIKQNNDLVKLYGQLSSGICNVSFQIYIPTGKTGYFNSLNRFVPGDANGNQKWAFECYFNSGGSAALTAGSTTATNFSYTYDIWHPVVLKVDLDLDSAQLWFDGAKIKQWQWTKGYNGAGGYPLQFDATDFFGPDSTKEMYIDNFFVNYTSTITSTSAGGNWNSASTWNGGVIPSSGDLVKIVSGSSINLDANISRSSRLVVSGTLKCSTNVISGTSDFYLLSGSTIEIGSTLGITSSGSSGNIQNTGIRNYSASANYIYNGTTAQNTGIGLPTTVNNLTINNPSGVSLTNSNTVTGSLNLLSGNFSLAGKTLTLGNSATNTGTLNWTAGFLVGSGTFKRWFSTTSITIGSASGLFPMGIGTNNRNVWIAGTPSAGGTVSVQHTDATGTAVLSFTENSQTFNKRTNMNWTISNANGFTGSALSLRIQGSGITGINSLSDLNISLSSGVAGGSYSAATGNIANPQVNRSGITQANLNNTFYIASTSNSPLPVELVSFNAAIRGSVVQLNWETSTEVNNYGFDVERQAHTSTELSVTGWEKIGFVNGNGNSNSPKSYIYEDKTVNSGKYSYRLKQIDNDGQFEYSNIIEVELGTPNTLTLSQNYPNPFNPSTVIKFQLPNSSFVTLKVYDALGNEVVTLINEQKNAGEYEMKFDGSKFASGMYIYQLNVGNNVITKKMILMK